MNRLTSWIWAIFSKRTNARPPHQINRVRLNLEAFEERALPGSMLSASDWIAPLSWTGNQGGSVNTNSAPSYSTSGTYPNSAYMMGSGYLPSSTSYSTTVPQGSSTPVPLTPPPVNVGTAPPIELPLIDSATPTQAPTAPPPALETPTISLPTSPTDVSPPPVGSGNSPPASGGNPSDMMGSGNGQAPAAPTPTVKKSGTTFQRSTLSGSSASGIFAMNVSVSNSFSFGSATQADSSIVSIVASGIYVGVGGPLSYQTTTIYDVVAGFIPDTSASVPPDWDTRRSTMARPQTRSIPLPPRPRQRVAFWTPSSL